MWHTLTTSGAEALLRSAFAATGFPALPAFAATPPAALPLAPAAVLLTPRRVSTIAPATLIALSAIAVLLAAGLLTPPSAHAQTASRHEEPVFGGEALPWETAGAESLNVTILGQYLVTSATGIFNVEAFVHPDTGEEFALLAADSLYVVDLTDPRSPRRAGAFPMYGVSDPATNTYLGVRTWGTYAYAAEKHGPIGILDLSDPSSPTRVGEIPESDFCACSHADLVDGRPVCRSGALPEVHRIFIDERGILYAAGIEFGEGTHMYDVTGMNATDPAWLCHEHTKPDGTTGFYDHDVYAADGLLYTSKSRGTRWEILAGALFGDSDSLLCGPTPSVCGDNSNHPRLLAWFPQSGEQVEGTHAHSAWRVPDSPYLLTADELENGHIRIWDTTPVFQPIPQPPLFVSEFKPDQTCHSVHDPYVVRDSETGASVCYAAWYNKGIQVFELSPDGTPHRIGYYEHPDRWHQFDALCCDPTRPAESGGGNCFGIPFLDFLPDGRFVASELHNGLLVGQLLVHPSGIDDDGGSGGASGAESGTLRVLGLPGSRSLRVIWSRIPGTEAPVSGDQTSSHLEIYSPGGVVVARLAAYSYGSGRLEFRWDHRDAEGRELPSGVYFARLDPDDGPSRGGGRRSGGLLGGSVKLVVLR